MTRFDEIDELITQIAHDTQDGSYVSSLTSHVGRLKAEISKLEHRNAGLIKEKSAIAGLAQQHESDLQRLRKEHEQMRKSYQQLFAAYSELLDLVNLSIVEHTGKVMAKSSAPIKPPTPSK